MALNKDDFKVVSCYPTQTDTTRIVIQSKDSNTWLQRDVPGRFEESSVDEQIQKVLDILAIETDPSGALVKAQSQLDKNTEALDANTKMMNKVQESMVALITQNDLNGSRLDAIEQAIAEAEAEEGEEHGKEEA